jgi:hypothetical protein
LRPCPLSNTRARAASFAGTSSTRSPPASSPLGDRPADPVSALDRPHPLRPLPGEPEHAPVAAGIGAERAGRAQHLAGVAGLDRHRPLVRVHPDHHAVHHRPPHLDPTGHISEDGQRCFQQSRPFSSHASPRCLGRVACHQRATPRPRRWAAASESVRPGTYPRLTGQPAPSNKQPMSGRI